MGGTTAQAPRLRSGSAAMPAGLGCFALMSFFIGTAEYAGAFVAQYVGAGVPYRATCSSI